MVRVAINGYGRIGRMAHRVILQWHADELEVVAINAGHSTDIAGWMYLLKYDSVYGLLPTDISIKPNPDPNNKDLLGYFVLGGKDIPVYSQKDPSLLPWKDLNVDVVIESTGHFTSNDTLQAHLTAGAKTVVLSAPAKGGDVPTYIVSINEETYKGEKIINNASCTTNCITPVAKVIEENFGIDKAMMTTIHAYTSDQKLHDGGHKDYRRARAAGLNIVPTSTGATIAAAEALPSLKGIFAGLSVRVPVPVGSLSDFTFVLKKEVTVDVVNDALIKAAATPVFKGILAVSNDPLVSSDIIGNSHSSIVDLSLTQVVGGTMVKVIAWYDNEYGYANRLIEQVIMVGQQTAAITPPSPAQPGSVPSPSLGGGTMGSAQVASTPLPTVDLNQKPMNPSSSPLVETPRPPEPIGVQWEPNPVASAPAPMPSVPQPVAPSSSNVTGGQSGQPGGSAT